jgi:hypothetical protein
MPSCLLAPFRASSTGTVQGAAGNVFHAYVLRPDPAVANKYTVIYHSGLQTVPAVATGKVETVAVPPSIAVAANDVIGFYGQGIPHDYVAQAPNSTVSYPAPVAPALSSTMTLGVDSGFPIFPQNRIYSFAATVTPSS